MNIPLVSKRFFILFVLFKFMLLFGSCAFNPDKNNLPANQKQLSDGLLSLEYLSKTWEILASNDGKTIENSTITNDYLYEHVWLRVFLRRGHQAAVIRHHLYCFKDTVNEKTIKSIVDGELYFPITKLLPVSFPYSNNYLCTEGDVSNNGINCYVATSHHNDKVVSLLLLKISSRDTAVDRGFLEEFINLLHDEFSNRLEELSCG